MIKLSLLSLAVAVNSRATIRVTEDSKIFYYNQYGADDNTIRDCDFGHEHTHMYITQIQANHCQLVKVPQFAEEKYMHIKYNATSNQITEFGDICSPDCSSCTEVIKPEANVHFNPCFSMQEGSAAIFENHCVGSSNLIPSNTFVAVYYMTKDCSVNVGNLHDVQYVRSYPKTNTNGCIPDHVSGDHHYYYSLSFTEDGGQTRITAKLQCEDSSCTQCEYHLSEFNEDACSVGSVYSMQFKEMSSLDHCNGGIPPPPPPPPTNPPPPAPPGAHWGCFANRCALDHSGAYSSEEECLQYGRCAKPPPPPPGQAGSYSCFAYRCVLDYNGPFPSLGDCVDSNECAKPPPPPGPAQPMYNCSIGESNGKPTYQCVESEETGYMTEYVCSHECVGPPDWYACVDQKCVEVPVTQPGIPKETCEDICHPDTAFIKDVVQQSPGPQQGYKEV